MNNSTELIDKGIEWITNFLSMEKSKRAMTSSDESNAKTALYMWNELANMGLSPVQRVTCLERYAFLKYGEIPK